MSNTPPVETIVWGPPAIDWLNVQHGYQRESPSDRQEVFLFPQPGGVALLARLLEAMSGKPGKKVLSTKAVEQLVEEADSQDTNAIAPRRSRGGAGASGGARTDSSAVAKIAKRSPLDPVYRHTWSTWVKFKGKENSKGEESAAYRMLPPGITNWETERFERDSWETERSEKDDQPDYSLKLARLSTSEDSLLVLDDPGLIYASELIPSPPQRQDNSKRADQDMIERQIRWLGKEDVLGWIKTWATMPRRKRQIILRLDSRSAEQIRALADSPLYRYIQGIPEVAQCTTLVTKVRDLRASEARVGASLSWERMFDDVIKSAQRAFWKDRQFEETKGFQRAIVIIGLSGAVLIDSTDRRTPYSLVFDRMGQEGDFEAALEGTVLGSSTCLVAALATAWEENRWEPTKAKDPSKAKVPSLLAAMERGVEMMRRLAKSGYLPSNKPRHRRVLEFPITRVRDCYYDDGFELGKTGHGLGRIQRPEAFGTRGTILADRFTDGQLNDAKNIVLRGESALQNVPIGKVQNWYSADRTEIEGVRSVHNAIREYLRKKDQRPLSIAVFGPPGAGKSFIVEQIAKALEIKESAQLTFNLSQFESAAELARAFHQVQDVLLSGVDPLVFWDEFDSKFGTQQLGWLRHFLAPMQDAKFVDQGQVHPVGRGIYIFAGGTCESYDEFVGEGDKELRDAKKPDFVSRIRAYIDVKGPNPARPRANRDSSAQADDFYMIRRAFLLRGSLDKDKNAARLKSGHSYTVDDGVLNAFLQAKKYKHGSRSLNSIVALSSFEGKAKYELSSLPHENLLAMHLDDVDDFIRHLISTPKQ